MDIPRRNRLDLNIPAEKAIYNVMQEIEEIGCDVRLTQAIILLGEARNLVADYIDKIEVVKDKYTYLKLSVNTFSFFKNGIRILGATSTENEAKYLCYALENFDDLEFDFSDTYIILYLDGRIIGELKVNYVLAEKIIDKMSKIFKRKPRLEDIDISDIGWEYDN